MSDYTSTFTESTGDTIDVTDFTVEFNAIQTAIASKVEANDATTLATAIAAAYPVGSIYMSTVSTNPNTLFGVGTWVAIEDAFLIGASATYAAASTGGSADAIVVAHTHTGTTDSDGAHTHAVATNDSNNFTPDTTVASNDGSGSTNNIAGAAVSDGAHTHAFTTGSTGSSGTNANLPPYLSVYMWKRTA